jgi:hypothetical protein
MDCFFLAATCTAPSIVLVLLVVVEVPIFGSADEEDDED